MHLITIIARLIWKFMNLWLSDRDEHILIAAAKSRFAPSAALHWLWLPRERVEMATNRRQLSDNYRHRMPFNRMQLFRIQLRGATIGCWRGCRWRENNWIRFNFNLVWSIDWHRALVHELLLLLYNIIPDQTLTFTASDVRSLQPMLPHAAWTLADLMCAWPKWLLCIICWVLIRRKFTGRTIDVECVLVFVSDTQSMCLGNVVDNSLTFHVQEHRVYYNQNLFTGNCGYNGRTHGDHTYP